MNWVALGDPQPQDTAVVIGAGVIGLMCLQLLNAVVERVIVVEPSPLRAGLAADLGADLVIDPLGRGHPATPRRRDRARPLPLRRRRRGR